MSIWIDGQRVESFGPPEPLSKEDLLEAIEAAKKAFEENFISTPRFIYMNDPMAEHLEWIHQPWYEGTGLYELNGDDGHPVFINDGMMEPELVQFCERTYFDPIDLRFKPKDKILQSGQDKSDMFSKRKKKR